MVSSPLSPVWSSSIGRQLGRLCNNLPPSAQTAVLSSSHVPSASLRSAVRCSRPFATSRKQQVGPAPRGLQSTRLFSTSNTWNAKPKTVQQLKAQAATGPFSWKAALLFIGTGVGMVFYFRYEKERLERMQVAELNKGAGRPKVGGPFTLKDTEGNVFTEESLKGKYAFVRSNWKLNCY